MQVTTRYNLRNSNDIQTIHTNSNLFHSSFFPATIRAWNNNFSDDTKEATSIASFKFHLNRNISKPPIYYNTGSRKGQILHSRMRMECSSLKSISSGRISWPIPLASVELLIAHIFFNCPRYAAARTIYLPNNINAYTSHDFLFGTDNKTQGENETLFSQVKEFIVNT